MSEKTARFQVIEGQARPSEDTDYEGGAVLITNPDGSVEIPVSPEFLLGFFEDLGLSIDALLPQGNETLLVGSDPHKMHLLRNVEWTDLTETHGVVIDFGTDDDGLPIDVGIWNDVDVQDHIWDLVNRYEHLGLDEKASELFSTLASNDCDAGWLRHHVLTDSLPDTFDGLVLDEQSEPVDMYDFEAVKATGAIGALVIPGCAWTLKTYTLRSGDLGLWWDDHYGHEFDGF